MSDLNRSSALGGSEKLGFKKTWNAGKMMERPPHRGKSGSKISITNQLLSKQILAFVARR
jgi:hypothetical protein